MPGHKSLIKPNRFRLLPFQLCYPGNDVLPHGGPAESTHTLLLHRLSSSATKDRVISILVTMKPIHSKDEELTLWSHRVRDLDLDLDRAQPSDFRASPLALPCRHLTVTPHKGDERGIDYMANHSAWLLNSDCLWLRGPGVEAPGAGASRRHTL